MKKFVNREEELAYLESEYNRDSASLTILYGRRRTGKTALISKFGVDKNMLYFFVTEESEHENRNNFKDLVSKHIGSELLSQADVKSWEVIFKELVQYRKEERKLIVIDEFQYLGKSNNAFPSIFQKIWDTILKDENVMVILCGSLISMMEAQTLSYSSPLYGRRTGQIKLAPIKFKHYHEFYSGRSRKELIEYYSVTGGVPKYIELFENSKDIFSAIDKNILETKSFLYEEPLFLLQNEVSELGTYFSLIKTIAAGNHKLSKITSALSIKQTNLSKYLRTLIDLDILTREVPITEEQPEKSKKGLYKIKDNYIEFWFKFIYPNKSFIETGHKDFALEKIKNNLVDSHTAFVYEDICIEEMWELNMKGELNLRFDKIGRWWNAHHEIDIVAYDSKGQDIVFGECKYTVKPIDTDIYYALVEKAKHVKWKQDRIEHFVFFSINGFTKKMEDLAKTNPNTLLFS
jgi:uncharacterized protein